ncbi:phage scaffolding protein [Pediococcus acidilactici]
MERREILDLGVDESIAKQIMILHAKDMQAANNKVREAEQERDSAKSQITDYEKEVANLKKSLGDNEEAQQQISDLQAQLKDSKKTHESELAQLKTDNAIELALRDANVRDSKAVMPFIDKDTIKLEDGQIKGLNEQIESIKADHDYLFNSDEPAQPAGPSSHATPAGNRIGGGDEIPDITKMSYNEVINLKNEDPDTYAAAVEQSTK